MLLSCQTAERLQLVTFAFSVHTSNIDTLLEEFEQLFQGISCLKWKMVYLHIDKSIRPVALHHCRVVFHLRPKFEEELHKLDAADIIEKVESLTLWVPHIVVTRKPKQPEEVRLCMDMRIPYLAIRLERLLTPTVDDIVGEVT